MKDETLRQLDAIINQAIIETEELDPDGDEAQFLWVPLQEIGYAVDQVKALRRGDRLEKINEEAAALPPAGGR